MLLGPVLGGAATVVGPEVVFSGVSVVAAGLAAWAWRTPGVVPEPSSGLAALVGALRRRDVLIGFWLFTLPALLSGVIEVLAPLRLDELGATGAAIGAIFLVTAAVEGVLSPVAGRVSDRRGRLVPIRFGLLGAIVMSALLPLPNDALLLGMAILLTFAALGAFWAPALAWLSDASEDAGLDLAFAFSHIQPRLGDGTRGGKLRRRRDRGCDRGRRSLRHVGRDLRGHADRRYLTGAKRPRALSRGALTLYGQFGQGDVPARRYSFRATRS